ncbi:MAG: serine hydrolase [Saprospiraceae bacterium]|nr:serine hydrolase [Saprospiraceae bacterium]
MILALWGGAFTALDAQDLLPLDLPGVEVKPLRSLVDTALQNDLFHELSAIPGWSAMIRSKKLAVGLVDLRDPFNARFARVNGNEMMYAASLPKIAILLAAVDAFEKGELMETGRVMQDLHAMIRYSNNQASTRLIDLLGYDKIEEVLTDPRYEFYDEEYGGGLWVGKRYAASGARHPDPIKGLSHAATVSQVCRFYYLMAYGELVNRVRSKQMMEIMTSPALYHKFVHTLKQVAPRAKLYRKSGSWRTYHSDSVMVWGENPNRRYILVALADSPNGEQIIRRVVRVVEKVLEIQ